MRNSLVISKKINSFNDIIQVSGDKSLSIRWVLFSSISSGVSISKNLLMSEDVIASIKAVRKLGIKVITKKNTCKIFGNGINGYKYKKNLKINAQNSGTLGRLILGLIIDTPFPIKITGDNSLSKRDFKRVTDPLSKFGAKFRLKNNFTLPLTIKGSSNLKSINYLEKKGSAQCKSAVILGALKSDGETTIKAKKSRNHTELLCKHLNIPIKVYSRKNYDYIKIKKTSRIDNLDYNIPSDISSSAFFIVLTALSKNSKLTIKNVNINPTRTGVISILKRMGVNIKISNKKIYKGEINADIKIKSTKKLKPINCPVKYNSGAIDEFLIIFLVAARANGISYFKDLAELDQKESPRLKWGSKILNLMGVKNILTKSSIKIFGNPKLKLEKKIIIKNYLKDHRIFMSCVIAALTYGGKWEIHNKNSIKTSFPQFLKIIKKLKNAKK